MATPWYRDAYDKVSNEVYNPDSIFRRELLPKIPNELLNPDSVFRREYVPPIRAALGMGRKRMNLDRMLGAGTAVGGRMHGHMTEPRRAKRGGFFHHIDRAMRDSGLTNMRLPGGPPLNTSGNRPGIDLGKMFGAGKRKGGNLMGRISNEFTNADSVLRRGANAAAQVAYEQAMNPNSFARATAIPTAVAAAPYLLKLASGRGKLRRQSQPGDGRARRGAICRQVMLANPGMTLMQASSYVKQHGLYKP
jgi:hypothetical protein